MAIFVRSTSDAEESLTLALHNVKVDGKGNFGLEPVVRCQYEINDLLMPRDKAQIISEVSYPVDSRTPEEKDMHFTLHKFHSLIQYLQMGKENDKDRNEEDNSTDHCDWSPIPVNGESQEMKKEGASVTFRCLRINKEEELEKSSGVDEITFYIIKQKYAVIDRVSISAWVNLDAEREIPFNLIR